ncbi:MAG: autotransporter outer membrane beta-barrel domain-containing protein, partial [Bdellovibrionales bacterium]
EGESDQTIVTGTANIGGGTISLLPEEGSIYGVGTTYTFLTAGAVTNTFDNITLTTASLFLDAALSYDSTHAYATLTRNNTPFTSAAITPNQTEVSAALDTLNGSNAVYNAIAGQSTLIGTQTAFSALTGELHAGIKGSLLEEDFFIHHHLSFAGKGLWAQAYGDWNERNGDDGVFPDTRRFTHKEKGIAFGYTSPAGGWLARQNLLDTVGISFAYGRSDYDVAVNEGNRASGDTDHYRLTAYGQKQVGPLMLKTSGQYGLHQIKTDRDVFFTGYSDKLTADYHAQTLQGTAEASAKLPTPIYLEPFARISYGMAQIGAIDEIGGGAALHADSDLTTQGSSVLGFRLGHTLRLTGATFRQASQTDLENNTACNHGVLTTEGIPCAFLYTQAGWKHLIGSAYPTGTYNFTGSQTFTTSAAAAPRNAAIINVGVGLPLTPQATFDVNYMGSHAPEASANAFRTGFTWKW